IARQEDWARKIRPADESNNQQEASVGREHEKDALDLRANDRSSLTVGRVASRRDLRVGHGRNGFSVGAWAGSSPVAETWRPRGSGSRAVRGLEEQNYRDRKVVALGELAKLSATGKTSSEATHSIQKARWVAVPRRNLRDRGLLWSLLDPLS